MSARASDRERARAGGRAHAGVVALTLLLLALPLLLGALAAGSCASPREGLQAASTRDVSAAALDRIERYLHGDLTVVPAGLCAHGGDPSPERHGGLTAPRGGSGEVAFPAPATVERLL